MNERQDVSVISGIRLALHGRYLGVMLLTTIVMYFFLSISMQVLLLDPVIFFNTQMAFGSDMKLEGKLFLYIAPPLFGLALTLMIYRIRELKSKLGKNEALTSTGLIASLFTPGCSVCLPLVLSSIGVSYGIFNSIITPLIIPIQIFVYTTLLISIYLLSKDICIKCFVKKTKR